MTKSTRLCAVLGASVAAVLLLFLGSAAAAPGDLDPTFGTGGETELALGSVAVAEGIALQPDGKIVVAGSGPGGFTLARFDADGTVDRAFGSGGKVEGPGGAAYAVVRQPDGKLLAAGGLDGGPMAVVRYTADGNRDSSFGTGGIASGPLGTARGLVLQPDGKIVLCGSSPDPDSSAHDNVVLLRFEPDGTPDAGFGSNGVVRTRVGTSSRAWALALQPDGKILAAGSGGDFAGSLAVVRYRPDGELDPSFGTSGVVMAAPTLATAIGVQPDGRIVVAGTADLRLAVMRFAPDGRVDPSFGSNGLMTTGSGGLGGAWDLALQADGRIVISGWDTSVFTLVRLSTGGELDPSFAEGGISRASFGFWSDARAVAIQPDGRILAAGLNSHESETNFALARYRVTSPTSIGAAPLVVPYGATITLEGTAADPEPGAAVQILGRDCYAYSTARSRATAEDTSGAWTATVTPRGRTSYRAEIAGDRSIPVEVQVRPRVTLRRLTRSRVQARVVYGHSLAGETIDLQRFRQGSGWGHIRYGSLRRLGRAKGGVVSSVTIKTGQRRGPVRALLEQPNPYACFATAVSRAIPR